MSPKINTLRSLTLNYGVFPCLVNNFHDTDTIIKESIQNYLEKFNGKKGDIIIITGGMPIDSASTDFMKIEKIND